MLYRIIFMSIVGLLSVSCAQVTDFSNNEVKTDGWLIPSNLIYDGGPGKDGIPSLDDPKFVSLNEAGYLSSLDRLIVYKNGSKIRAYPHRIMDWHEIANDDADGFKFTVSYCPLTGSGIGYESVVNNGGTMENTTFGVSGLLYNNNLILYDRRTDSYWAQMLLQCVGGPLRSQRPFYVHLVETTVGTLKKFYPEAQVLSNVTYIYEPEQYNIYPYGDYRSNNDNLLFPVSPDDRRLPRKERVLVAIATQEKRAYRFTTFINNIQVINDKLGFESIVVAGSNGLDFIVAYLKPNPTINMKNTSKPYPNIMEDDKGNVYDLFGNVTEGPAKGTKLTAVKSYIAYWFAAGAIFPGIDIYGE